jgi:hypothetical protein
MSDIIVIPFQYKKMVILNKGKYESRYCDEPRGGSVSTSIFEHRTAPPCLGEALRRGALIKL